MAIRAKKITLSAPVSKPSCRVHKTTMIYSPDVLAWRCMIPGCESVAYPREDDSGRPIIGKGEVELLVHTDEDGYRQVYLRAEDNNVVLNITKIMTLMDARKTSTKVTLDLDRVVVLDEYGRRK